MIEHKHTPVSPNPHAMKKNQQLQKLTKKSTKFKAKTSLFSQIQSYPTQLRFSRNLNPQNTSPTKIRVSQNFPKSEHRRNKLQILQQPHLKRQLFEITQQCYNEFQSRKQTNFFLSLENPFSQFLSLEPYPFFPCDQHLDLSICGTFFENPFR